MLESLNQTITLELIGPVNIYLGVGIQIIFALLLGGIVGYDREVKLKAAGLKTNIMICIGATLYTALSIISLQGENALIDPNRVPAQIVSGIGFLGAGAIIQGRGSVTGLTTAATIWVVAAIGYCIGVGYPIIATLFSVTVLIILKLIDPLTRAMELKKDHSAFHFEILSYQNAWIAFEHIFANEEVEIKYFEEEEDVAAKKFTHINIFITGHKKAAERISHELSESIKVKKMNFRDISAIPEHILTSGRNALDTLKIQT